MPVPPAPLGGGGGSEGATAVPGCRLALPQTQPRPEPGTDTAALRPRSPLSSRTRPRGPLSPKAAPRGPQGAAPPDPARPPRSALRPQAASAAPGAPGHTPRS
ncbi:unnamed protein product [Rangifer tarandus platyrhynchus]|uniref:Uncharacterized protein n=2 Tax=Rangifer tarandus platyrhynchus TaxID=3082113 RepID=A0ABN8XL13_RANTA|nr:unnamed protein product [Rangifer tarandus platyrhynchus]